MKNSIMALSILVLSSQSFAATGVDDSKVNERDRASHELTADQQAYSTNDMNITRRIRQDIMKQENFSTYAQNVKIITINGKVTLKGPVQSEKEKSSILKFAILAAGAPNVINQMSVATNK